MKTYTALLLTEIRLAFRRRVVIFVNYLMPLLFFFIFAQSFHADQGGAILQVFTMVTVIGILGNGIMGAGMRAVQDRETNILRRFKVAPISALPLLVASTVTGLIVYLPLLVVMFAVATVRYGMTMPQHPVAVLTFILLGVVAMRAIGLILSSVVNSMAEAQVLVQILYIGMLMLSGAAFPAALFPDWLFNVTQFIPSTYLVGGLQGIMIRNETLLDNWQSVCALVLTTIMGLFLSVKLFRWEKDEKIRPAGKLWLLAVLLPFIVLGAWQAHAKSNAVEAKIIDRELSRSRTLLIRNARIIIGDGKVIEHGAVLVKAGKIAEVYDGDIPDPKSLNAQPVEAEGKTLLPGRVEMNAHLTGDQKAMRHQLALYLYRGFTTVKGSGNPPDTAAKVKQTIDSGERLGAQFNPGDANFGLIGIGKDADLLAVDGNPDQDPRALEAISFVIFKGERVDRADLLKPEE